MTSSLIISDDNYLSSEISKLFNKHKVNTAKYNIFDNNINNIKPSKYFYTVIINVHGNEYLKSISKIIDKKIVDETEKIIIITNRTNALDLNNYPKKILYIVFNYFSNNTRARDSRFKIGSRKLERDIENYDLSNLINNIPLTYNEVKNIFSELIFSNSYFGKKIKITADFGAKEKLIFKKNKIFFNEGEIENEKGNFDEIIKVKISYIEKRLKQFRKKHNNDNPNYEKKKNRLLPSKILKKIFIITIAATFFFYSLTIPAFRLGEMFLLRGLMTPSKICFKVSERTTGLIMNNNFLKALRNFKFVTWADEFSKANFMSSLYKKEILLKEHYKKAFLFVIKGEKDKLLNQLSLINADLLEFTRDSINTKIEVKCGESECLILSKPFQLIDFNNELSSSITDKTLYGEYLVYLYQSENEVGNNEPKIFAYGVRENSSTEIKAIDCDTELRNDFECKTMKNFILHEDIDIDNTFQLIDNNIEVEKLKYRGIIVIKEEGKNRISSDDFSSIIDTLKLSNIAIWIKDVSLNEAVDLILN